MKRHPQKEDKKPNKTAFIKVRCTAEEKERIRSRATNAGRKYSDYCREMLLSGSVIAVPPMGNNEKEALATYAKIAFKRFFSPRYWVPEEVFKRLNIEDHDRKV